jgi:hypothetical protein
MTGMRWFAVRGLHATRMTSGTMTATRSAITATVAGMSQTAMGISVTSHASRTCAGMTSAILNA